MKKKLFLRSIVLMLAISLVACSVGPSVCDIREGQKSYLCETADKLGVRLEDAGNILMVANLVAIEEGAYTADQAREVFEDISALVMSSTSYSFLQKQVMKKVDSHPGLFIIATLYLPSMDLPQIISEFDQKTLISWLNIQIMLLGG